MQFQGAQRLQAPLTEFLVERESTTEMVMLAKYGPTMTIEEIAPLVKYTDGTLRQYIKRKAFANHPMTRVLKSARIPVTGLVFNTSKIAAFLDGRYEAA